MRSSSGTVVVRLVRAAVCNKLFLVIDVLGSGFERTLKAGLRASDAFQLRTRWGS